MVQYNSYSVVSLKKKVVLEPGVREIKFKLAGGDGGGNSRGLSYYSGNGAFLNGTYRYNSNERRYFTAYAGQDGVMRDGDSNTTVVSRSHFADGGIAGSSYAGNGGSMSAIGVNGLIGVAGGGGGAAMEAGADEIGGGGGSPGGLGGTKFLTNDGTDAETISASFAQGVGGDGGEDPNGSTGGIGDDGSAAAKASVSNISTGVTEFANDAGVTVTSHGPPDKITDLTTSLDSNYNPVLSWSAPNNGITQKIYRKGRTENAYSQIGTTADSNGAFVDTSTPPNTTLLYKIVQNDNYFQDGNVSPIHTLDERVQVYRNGSWEPATLQTY